MLHEPEQASQAGNRYTVTYTSQRWVLKITTINVNHFMYQYESQLGCVLTPFPEIIYFRSVSQSPKSANTCEPERASQAGNRYTVAYTTKRWVLKITTINMNHFIYPCEASWGVYYHIPTTYLF